MSKAPPAKGDRVKIERIWFELSHRPKKPVEAWVAQNTQTGRYEVIRQNEGEWERVTN